MTAAPAHVWPEGPVAEVYGLRPGALAKAHDIRRLAVCRYCKELGMDTPIVQAKRTRDGKMLRDKEYAHGRCLVDAKGGVDALLILPTEELDKVRLGDIGVELMIVLRDTVAARHDLTVAELAVLRHCAGDFYWWRKVGLRGPPGDMPDARRVAMRNGTERGAAVTERTLRRLGKRGLVSWGAKMRTWNVTNDGYHALYDARHDSRGH